MRLVAEHDRRFPGSEFDDDGDDKDMKRQRYEGAVKQIFDLTASFSQFSISQASRPRFKLLFVTPGTPSWAWDSLWVTYPQWQFRVALGSLEMSELHLPPFTAETGQGPAAPRFPPAVTPFILRRALPRAGCHLLIRSFSTYEDRDTDRHEYFYWNRHYY